ALHPDSGCGVQNCAAGSDHVFDEKYLAIFDSGLPVPVIDLSIPQDERVLGGTSRENAADQQRFPSIDVPQQPPGEDSHKGASCGSCSCASSLDVGRS